MFDTSENPGLLSYVTTVKTSNLNERELNKTLYRAIYSAIISYAHAIY